MNKKDKELFELFKKGELNLSKLESISMELFKKIASLDSSILKEINKAIITDEMIFIAIESNPMAVSSLDLSVVGDSLVRELIERNPLTLRFLDRYKVDEKLAKKVLKADLSLLAYCPEIFHTKENFLKLIEDGKITKIEEDLLISKDYSFKKEIFETSERALDAFVKDPDMLIDILKKVGKLWRDGNMIEASTGYSKVKDKVKYLDEDIIIDLFEENVLLFKHLPLQLRTEENSLKCISESFFPFCIEQTPEVCYQALLKSDIFKKNIDNCFEWIVDASSHDEFKSVKDDYISTRKSIEEKQAEVKILTEKYFKEDFDEKLEVEIDKCQMLLSTLEANLTEVIENAEYIFGKKNIWF